MGLRPLPAQYYQYLNLWMCQKVDVFSECLCYSMSYFTEMLVLSLSEVSGKPEPEQPGALPDILLRNN